MEAFGERVRSLRTEIGLSQEKLAETTGLHMSYISSIERGRRNVSLLNIIRLAEALAVDPSALVASLSTGPPS